MAPTRRQDLKVRNLLNKLFLLKSEDEYADKHGVTYVDSHTGERLRLYPKMSIW
jgi:hypothetical protein